MKKAHGKVSFKFLPKRRFFAFRNSNYMVVSVLELTKSGSSQVNIATD